VALHLNEGIAYRDQIYISMIRQAGLYNKISQAYAGIDTNKAVGVMGDQRYEGYIVILRYVCVLTFAVCQLSAEEISLTCRT